MLSLADRDDLGGKEKHRQQRQSAHDEHEAPEQAGLQPSHSNRIKGLQLLVNIPKSAGQTRRYPLPEKRQ